MTKTTTRGAAFIQLLTDLHCSAQILAPAEAGGYQIATVRSGTTLLGKEKPFDCAIQHVAGKEYTVCALTQDGAVLMDLFDWTNTGA